MNTYFFFVYGETPQTPPFGIFLQINYLQLKVHNPQFILDLSLREEIPLPLSHVLDAFFSFLLEDSHKKSVPTFDSCSI
jgi:hypothetical protein